MDKIIIKGLRLYAYHGVNPEEKENGQPFVLDVTYYLPLEKACGSDDLNDTVSYAAAVKVIRKAFCEEKYDLIERAAQRVAEALLAQFQTIIKTEVTVKKPEAPVKADFDYMAVSITRER